MSCLVALAYDPGASVSKVTTAALAMTALDTTNLRATFTAPSTGKVLIRLRGCLHGATTFPQILLGVLEGATVRHRQAPQVTLGGTAAATTFAVAEAQFVITGLTPTTSYSYDAAYGVETLVASTGLKYGGADDATANNAFGAFIFEVWEA